ncbi:MAG: PaaI family thioesterase [Thermodesulfovibrionia bacterium]|nr:PaaI family thioesterase [Thermodesulfovibrionia bacterium]
MMELADNGYCFVCGPKNPIGLKLNFHFNGKSIKTQFTPKKEHQGYLNIVHGGIISTVLDEAMVKLALAMNIPAVTASMEIRLRRALNVGETINVEAEILKNTKKTLETYAKATTEINIVIADAKGKLIKV